MIEAETMLFDKTFKNVGSFMSAFSDKLVRANVVSANRTEQILPCAVRRSASLNSYTLYSETEFYFSVSDFFVLGTNESSEKKSLMLGFWFP